MTRHYREAIDAPVSMLGDRAPRELAKTPEGREKVVEWLKYLQNQNDARGDDEQADYDFGWLWAELGLADRRR